MSAGDETLPAAGAPGPAAATSFGPDSRVAGRYRIERFIAAGAMGEVFEAEDLIVGGRVALKTLRPELERSAMAMERLRREIMLARKVTNAHICRLHDVGEHEGRVFITMELLDGKTLSEVLAERGTVPVEEVARIARQLVDGLAALHAHGIVHRDFKTSNVMLVGERAVITDFGLARSIEPDALASLTVEASMLGTPAYMAPEQVEGRPATPACDIYALGIVLFELLTGEVPFREETALATATARLQHDPPRPSARKRGIPAQWDARVLRCLARAPADRFANAADVLDAPVRRLPSRRWFLAASGAGLAGLGAVAWRMFGDAPTRRAFSGTDVVRIPVPAGDAVARALHADIVDALASAGISVTSADLPAKRTVKLEVEADRVTVDGRAFARFAKREPALVEEIAHAIAASLGTFKIRSAADAGYTDHYAAYARMRAGGPMIVADSQLARAHAWLALSTGDVTHAQRALAIDPDNAVALAARGRAAMFAWDWSTADADTKRAVELAPASTQVTMIRALLLHVLGKFEASFPLFDRNLARDPDVRRTVAWAYVFGRRFQRGIDLMTPFAADPLVAAYVLLAHAEMSRFDVALTEAKTLRGQTNDPDVLALIVQGYVSAGETAEARAIVDEVRAHAKPYHVAIALDSIGDFDGALAILDQIVATRGEYAVFLKVERFSSSLRAHARYQALVQKVFG